MSDLYSRIEAISTLMKLARKVKSNVADNGDLKPEQTCRTLPD